MSAEIRRQNLKKLLQDRYAGKIADMARAIDRDDAYLWQLLNADRNVGERVARHIESKLGLANGTLDQVDMVTSETLTPDELEMLQKYRRASPRWRLSLRLLAEVRDEDQNEVSESVNVLMAKIFAKPVSDERVAKAYGRPGEHTLHQPAAPYKKKR
jgi:hypothetical protein